MKKDSFTPLSAVFLQVAKKHRLQNHLLASHACYTADAIMKKIAMEKGKCYTAKAVELKNNCLTMRVNTSVQAQEINFYKMDILSQLNAQGFPVKSIKIKLA